MFKIYLTYYCYKLKKKRKIVIINNIKNIIEYLINKTILKINEKRLLIDYSIIQIQKIIRGKKGRKLFLLHKNFTIIKKKYELIRLEKEKEKNEEQMRIKKKKESDSLEKIKYIVRGFSARKKYVPLIRERTRKRLFAGDLDIFVVL